MSLDPRPDLVFHTPQATFAAWPVYPNRFPDPLDPSLGFVKPTGSKRAQKAL